MEIIASEKVKAKILVKHNVTFIEVEEAFNNFVGYPLVDNRAKNKSKPETIWCVSETFNDRILKLVFIPYLEENIAVLRTAYEPDDMEIAIWNENQ